jgi:hypothetical protein
MNVQLNPKQSDTKVGAIILPATADLTGKENRLVKITNDGGVAKFALPAAVTDLAQFILASGDVAANDNSAEAPDLGGNARVTLNGTCNPGDILVLCDPTASAGVNAGKVQTVPATAGQYFSPGVAEEAGVDEQSVRFRPLPRLIRVASTDTLTALTFTTGGATGPEVGALRTALKTILEAQGLMA